MLHQDLHSFQQYPQEWISPILLQIISLLRRSYGALLPYGLPFPTDRAPASLNQHCVQESTSSRVTPFSTMGTWEGQPGFLGLPFQMWNPFPTSKLGQGPHRDPCSPICLSWVGEDRRLISVPPVWNRTFATQGWGWWETLLSALLEWNRSPDYELGEREPPSHCTGPQESFCSMEVGEGRLVMQVVLKCHWLSLTTWRF